MQPNVLQRGRQKSCGKFIIGEETNYDEKGTGCECKKRQQKMFINCTHKKGLGLTFTIQLVSWQCPSRHLISFSEASAFSKGLSDPNKYKSTIWHKLSTGFHGFICPLL